MIESQNTAIGFLGGTFDPIHFGHLRPALEIQHALKLQSLYLMPNYIAPHKSNTLATPKQRIEMVELAIQTTPYLKINTQELLRESPSYTVDTLKLLKEQYPDTPICFIMGMDSLFSLILGIKQVWMMPLMELQPKAICFQTIRCLNLLKIGLLTGMFHKDKIII